MGNGVCLLIWQEVGRRLSMPIFKYMKLEADNTSEKIVVDPVNKS